MLMEIIRIPLVIFLKTKFLNYLRKEKVFSPTCCTCFVVLM